MIVTFQEHGEALAVQTFHQYFDFRRYRFRYLHVVRTAFA